MFQRVILTLEVEKWPQYRVPKEIQCRFLLEHFFFNKKRNKKVFRKEYFQIALRIFFAHFFCLLQDLILHMTAFIFFKMNAD